MRRVSGVQPARCVPGASFYPKVCVGISAGLALASHIPGFVTRIFVPNPKTNSLRQCPSANYVLNSRGPDTSDLD